MQRESQRALFDLSSAFEHATPSMRSLPIAVIGGEEDGLFRPHSVHWTAARHGVRAAILPGLGHTMMLDCRWRAVAQHMVRWLEENVIERTVPARGRRPRAARPGHTRSSASR